MAGSEIALRLRLAGRREAVDGLRDTADAARDVGQEAERAGRRALDGARGLAALGDRKLTAGVRGLAGSLGTGLVGGAKLAGVALAGLGAAAGALSVKAVQLATDAGETASAFGTVFGDQAASAQGVLDDLSSRFGLYGPDLQNAARGFGVFGKAAGVAQGDLGAFSTDLVQAGVDLGSFYNVDAAEAFQAIQSGLSGEAEPLRRFGIFLSDSALQAKAATMGLTGELTDQQKVAVRQRLILEGLGDAQGDLARTSGGLANQQRAVQNRAKGLAATLGKALMPAALGLASALNTGLTRATEWLEPRLPALTAAAERLGARFTAVGAQLPNLFGALRDLDTEGVGEVVDNMLGNTGQYVEPIRNGLDLVVAKFGEVRAVFTTLGAALPVALGPLGLAWKLLQLGAQHTTALRVGLTGLLGAWGAYRTIMLVNTVVTQGMAAALVVKRGAVLAATAATKLWNLAMRANPIGLVVTALGLLVAGVVLAYRRSETFRGIVDRLWAKIREGGRWVGDLAGSLRDKLVGAFQSARDWAGRVGDKLSGFVDKIRDAVRWVKDLAGQVRNLPGVGALTGAASTALSWLPGRELGGPVTAGQPYVVGERRAELFVPAVDGVILPRVPAVTPVAGSDGPALDAAALDDSRPLVVQLVVDRQVLAESAVGGLRAREARR